MPEGDIFRREMSVSRASMSVPRCTGVINRTRRRSTSSITLTKSEVFFSCCTRFYRASSNRSVYAVALCPSV